MLFQLTNTLIIFQDYIKKNFVKKLNIFVIVYLDNNFIYTKNKKKVMSKLYIRFLTN